MKKPVSILLSAVIIVSLTAIFAYAKNDPYIEPSQTEDGKDSRVSYLSFVEFDDEGSLIPDGGERYVYRSDSSGSTETDAVSGAGYDRNTNTLMLTDFDRPNCELEINEMGDDFSINVVGDCSLTGIVSYGKEQGVSVTVTGSGTLTLNEKRFLPHSIGFYARGSETACLIVDSGVSVRFYGEDGVIMADGVDENEEILVLSREPSEPLNIKTEQKSTGISYSVDVFNGARGPEEFSAIRVNPPFSSDGIWCAVPTELHGEEQGELPKEGYDVYHLIRHESLDALIIDVDAAGEFSCQNGKIELSAEEFESMGFTLAENGGENDWFTVDAYCTFAADQTVLTDGETEYVCMRHNDHESGTSASEFYTFKPIPGLGGVMMTDKLVKVDADSLEPAVTEVPIPGYFIRTVENTELHVGKDAAVKPVKTFGDVPPGEYFADAVTWAVRNNITAGTSENTFSPNVGCTRGQVVTFLWRAANEPEPESTENPFDDVSPDDYYFKAVLWAVGKEITMGTSNSTFSPNATCTRAQIVTLMYRAKGCPGPLSDNNPFTDVKEGDYFLNAVLWAVGKGITKGTDNTTFSPGTTCTRAQVVTFMYRGR